VPLVDARPAAEPVPLYLRDRNKPFWLEDVDSLGIFWIQFNAVQNAQSETLAAFSERAMAAAERSRASALVVDIRRNNGGDNTLLRPLIVALIRSRFNQTGRLFVVTGRLTFSAAMNFATQVQRYTEATFVGEPTGAPPNHYGETTRLKLPNSGITVLYSSLRWQDADPRDTRPWIEPSVRVPVLYTDYHTGRDPVLDSVVARRAGVLRR
jgi:C-terminal processing protease CtpA/Prc